MANYSWVVDDKTRMKKYSYDELAKPLVEQTKAHNELLDAAAEMDMQAGVLEGMLDEYKDPQTYAIYKNYIEGLKGQVDILNQRGLDYNSRANFWKYKGRYGKDIVPIQTAVNQRQEEQKQWNTLYMQNPDLMISKRPIDNSVDAYYNRSVEQPTVVNGQMIYQKAAGLAQAFAKQRLTESEQVIFDGLAYDLVQRYGTQKGFDELCKRYPELRAYKEKVMGEMGVRNLSLADQQRSSNYFDTGFNSGLSYDVKHNIHMIPQSSGSKKDSGTSGAITSSFTWQGEPYDKDETKYYTVEDSSGKQKTIAVEEMSNPVAGSLDLRLFPDRMEDDSDLEKFTGFTFMTSQDTEIKVMNRLMERYGTPEQKAEWEETRDNYLNNKEKGVYETTTTGDFIPIIKGKKEVQNTINQNIKLIKKHYELQNKINKEKANVSEYGLNESDALNLYTGMNNFKKSNDVTNIDIHGDQTREVNFSKQLSNSVNRAATNGDLFEWEDNKFEKSDFNEKGLKPIGNADMIRDNKGNLYAGMDVEYDTKIKHVYYKDDQMYMSRINDRYNKAYKSITNFDNNNIGEYNKKNTHVINLTKDGYAAMLTNQINLEEVVNEAKPINVDGFKTWYIPVKEMGDIIKVTLVGGKYIATSYGDIVHNNASILNDILQVITNSIIDTQYSNLQTKQ